MKLLKKTKKNKCIIPSLITLCFLFINIFSFGQTSGPGSIFQYFEEWPLVKLDGGYLKCSTYNTVFYDDFDSQSSIENNWNTSVHGTGSSVAYHCALPNQIFKADNIQVVNNNLRLYIKKNDPTIMHFDPPIGPEHCLPEGTITINRSLTGATLNTKETFNFGTYEMRAKWPFDADAWAAFWGWNGSENGEIDFIDIAFSSQYSTGVHRNSLYASTQGNPCCTHYNDCDWCSPVGVVDCSSDGNCDCSGGNWDCNFLAQEFHTYKCEFTPYKIVFSFDGNITNTVYKYYKTDRSPIDVGCNQVTPTEVVRENPIFTKAQAQFNPILWYGPSSSNGIGNNTYLEVDYVKITERTYQKINLEMDDILCNNQENQVTVTSKNINTLIHSPNTWPNNLPITGVNVISNNGTITQVNSNHFNFVYTGGESPNASPITFRIFLQNGLYFTKTFLPPNYGGSPVMYFTPDECTPILLNNYWQDPNYNSNFFCDPNKLCLDFYNAVPDLIYDGVQWTSLPNDSYQCFDKIGSCGGAYGFLSYGCDEPVLTMYKNESIGILPIEVSSSQITTLSSNKTNEVNNIETFTVPSIIANNPNINYYWVLGEDTSYNTPIFQTEVFGDELLVLYVTYAGTYCPIPIEFKVHAPCPSYEDDLFKHISITVDYTIQPLLNHNTSGHFALYLSKQNNLLQFTEIDTFWDSLKIYSATDGVNYFYQKTILQSSTESVPLIESYPYYKIQAFVGSCNLEYFLRIFYHDETTNAVGWNINGVNFNDSIYTKCIQDYSIDTFKITDFCYRNGTSPSGYSTLGMEEGSTPCIPTNEGNYYFAYGTLASRFIKKSYVNSQEATKCGGLISFDLFYNGLEIVSPCTGIEQGKEVTLELGNNGQFQPLKTFEPFTGWKHFKEEFNEGFDHFRFIQYNFEPDEDIWAIDNIELEELYGYVSPKFELISGNEVLFQNTSSEGSFVFNPLDYLAYNEYKLLVYPITGVDYFFEINIKREGLCCPTAENMENYINYAINNKIQNVLYNGFDHFINSKHTSGTLTISEIGLLDSIQVFKMSTNTSPIFPILLTTIYQGESEDVPFTINHKKDKDFLLKTYFNNCVDTISLKILYNDINNWWHVNDSITNNDDNVFYKCRYNMQKDTFSIGNLNLAEICINDGIDLFTNINYTSSFWDIFYTYSRLIRANGDSSCFATGYVLTTNSFEGARYVVTNSWDICKSGTISFNFMYGNSIYIPFCDPPEVGDEVSLEYTIDDGNNWTTINTYDISTFSVNTQVMENIPQACNGQQVRFRWIQYQSEYEKDTWFLDNVHIQINENLLPESTPVFTLFNYYGQQLEQQTGNYFVFDPSLYLDDYYFTLLMSQGIENSHYSTVIFRTPCEINQGPQGTYPQCNCELSVYPNPMSNEGINVTHPTECEKLELIDSGEEVSFTYQPNIYQFDFYPVNSNESTHTIPFESTSNQYFLNTPSNLQTNSYYIIKANDTNGCMYFKSIYFTY